MFLLRFWSYVGASGKSKTNETFAKGQRRFVGALFENNVHCLNNSVYARHKFPSAGLRGCSTSSPQSSQEQNIEFVGLSISRRPPRTRKVAKRKNGWQTEWPNGGEKATIEWSGKGKHQRTSSVVLDRPRRLTPRKMNAFLHSSLATFAAANTALKGDLSHL